MRIGKLLAAIFGGLILLVGAAMTTAGSIALGVSDADGWVTTPTPRITTDAAAIVGTNIDVDLGEAIDDETFISFGEIPARIDVESRNGKDIFIGIGTEADVARFLAETAHARVDFFDDESDVTTLGSGALVRDPAERDIWVASSTTGHLDWDLASGRWSIVVTNADGSPGVDVAVTGAAKIPLIEAIGIGLLVFGVLAIVGGAIMLYFGVRADPRRNEQVLTAPPPPAPPTAQPRTPASVG